MADVVVVPGRIARDEVGALCERVRALLVESGAGLVVCDVGACGDDLETVEALARLQLAAKRSGGLVRLRGAQEDLRRLLAFAGLSRVLPCEAGSGASVEVWGQPEQREPPLGVQEEDDPGDVPVR